MKLNPFLYLLLFTSLVFSQKDSITEKHIKINQHIYGTLLTPIEVKNTSLVIIIAGAGPTDRDGNQNFLKSNALKKLALGLTQEGISTFRYDKRVVKQIRQGRVDPNIMFDDFVADAISCVDYFKKNKSFNKVYIIGHSQGSLVGLLASRSNIDGFISLAGAGQSIDKVIIDQINQTVPMFTEDAKKVFENLKAGKITDDFPPALASVFRKDIQPFMMNWMQYNPQELISELEIPVLIINGNKDLQVSVDEANLLHKSSKNSELKIIKNMNHVLVPIEGGNLENSKSYNESYRKLSTELIESIVAFIKK